MSISPRRKPRRLLTWFKAGLLVVLGIGAASLCTPYPARLVRAWRMASVSVPPKKQTPKPAAAPAERPELPPPAAEPPKDESPAPVMAPGAVAWNPARSFSMPAINLPPFPPALPERVEAGNFEHLNTITKGINLRSSIQFTHGSTAAQDRLERQAYQVRVSMELKLPHAADGKELLHANPHLPKVLEQYDALMQHARVSPWFAALYLHKQNQVRKNAATLSKIIDRHNFFDTDTILEITAPGSQRKALWIQADMDVVSDGSDGDRLPSMPEKIRKSDFYQPTTSYRWKKRSNTPNPLLQRWQNRLAQLQKEKKASNADSIAYAKRVIADLKLFSFLLAEYDPFIVVPLVVQEGKDARFRPAAGDYAAVIVGKRVFPAIVGDFGPRYKAGEASLRLSKLVNPQADVYSRPVSDLGVSYIIFPGSKEAENGPIDYARLNTRCRELLGELGGMGQEAEFVEIQDLLAPPAAAPHANKGGENQGSSSGQEAMAAPPKDSPKARPAASRSTSTRTTPRKRSGK